ncbi:MAG: hypothetical protein ACYCXP_00900 [Leptospirillum sp.]
MPAQSFRWTTPPQDFNFSGPEALRAFFFPRQTLQIQEAARILGIGREALYKRLWRGDTSLKICKRPGSGRQFILLDNLICYLFPSQENPLTDPPEKASSDYTNAAFQEKRKVGRPRGSKNKTKSPVKEGGAK